MAINSQTPDLNRPIARTNAQTIDHRVALLRELAPHAKSIAEICCGDCTRQHVTYTQQLGVETYRGLDINPAVVATNRERGIDCYCGDALERGAMVRFVGGDVLFFGPPLSVDCDGHRLLSFDSVQPSYRNFANLLLNELSYTGLLVCICPKSTTIGDAAKLYHEIGTYRSDVNLRLIHHSHSTITGDGQQTERRLKYIELWFSGKHNDLWEIRY